MKSSDSEGFESADEGHSDIKKERKKRTSSSNYSDTASDNALEFRDTPLKANKNVNKLAEKAMMPEEKETDGWGDWDIEDNETLEPVPNTQQKVEKIKTQLNRKATVTAIKLSQDTGWDDFGDWGCDDSVQVDKKLETTKEDPKIQEVTEKLAASSTGGNSWGWGWSVDSILSTASAGLTTITSQVSQGISTVLETGIGAPEPEELARRIANDKKEETKAETETVEDSLPKAPVQKENLEDVNSTEGSFPFGNLISGVTKFVETTGTKVIAGGLDTLETIGKKTMEVLQDGDPGLAKKRAMLGLDSGDKPVLSQLLREAKAKADEEDKVREAKREAKEVHYENLFDDYEGLVHLEALEMLSRQVSMRVEEKLRSVAPEKRQDLKETLQQVAELCEMPEEDDDEEFDSSEDTSKADVFHERLQTATQDLGLKLQFQPLVIQYTDLLDWLASSENEITPKVVYKRGVSSLAQTTALCVEIYHKAGEMLLVKSRRSTADEADAMTQMTVVMTKHISEMATLFTEKLNSIPSENKDQTNNYITNIFLEAGNSSTYIQNAFQLALPILQIGAV